MVVVLGFNANPERSRTPEWNRRKVRRLDSLADQSDRRRNRRKVRGANMHALFSAKSRADQDGKSGTSLKKRRSASRASPDPPSLRPALEVT